jgi:pyrophosphatase PpaX
MSQFRAVIFDVDGTLLDTREFILQAFEHALQSHNHTPRTRAEIAALIGKGLHETYEILAPEGNSSQLALTHGSFQAKNLQLITAYTTLTEMLDTLKQRDLLLGAWSSRTENLEDSLRLTGIIDYFDVIIDGDQVQHFKPDPEGFYMALEKLAVTPEEAVMVGDAVHDINAGKAAGVGMTIAVTHGFGTKESLVDAGPTHIVHQVSDIPELIVSS